MPVVAAKVLGLQLWHLVAPVTFMKVPTAQLAQAVLPVVSVYLPAPHGVHAARLLAPDEADAVPAGHPWHWEARLAPLVAE